MSKHQERHEITWMSIHDLKPYEHNPRDNSNTVPFLAEAIKKHGFIDPIVTDQHNTICCGHTRWEAAKLIGMLRVPVIKIEMDEKEFIELNLKHNKIQEKSKWTNKRLKHLMEIVDDLESVKCSGFTDKEIDKVFGVSHLETHNSSADFGDSGEVDDKIDEEALEKRMAFVFNGKEHRVVSSKLKAIKKEHGLSNMAQALIKALEPYKGLSEPRLRKGGK